jgi:hypothetical protein
VRLDRGETGFREVFLGGCHAPHRAGPGPQ